MKNKQKNKRGFTLIELMVATSIFVVIMLAAMGSLFTLLGASKNSRALRTAMDNVNFSMESMTRSIRMGKNYYCLATGNDITPQPDLTRDCTGEENSLGGNSFAFIPQESSTRVAFMFHNAEYKNGVITNSTLQRCEDTKPCVNIISPDVNIDRLEFIVKGSSPLDSIQASVYIIMKGTVTIKGVDTSFAVQTMATQRNY